MRLTSSAVKARACGCLAFTAIAFLCISGPANAGLLPVGDEHQGWSDMAFPGGVSGGFDAGTKLLNIQASNSNDLELGPEYGPSSGDPDGRHYGPDGAGPSTPIGGPFFATLRVVDVEIQPDGTVTPDGTNVTVTYDNGVPNSVAGLAQHYGVNPGDLLLEGTVVEVLMNATGDDTLDVLWEVTGGALQTITNPILGLNYAPNGLGLLRISGSSLPADFSTSFDFTGNTKIDAFGLPEPTSLALGLLGALFVLASRPRRPVAG